MSCNEPTPAASPEAPQQHATRRAALAGLGVGLGTLGLASASRANSVAAKPPTTIAIVSVARILDESAAGKAAVADRLKRQEAVSNELKALRDRAEVLKERLNQLPRKAAERRPTLEEMARVSAESEIKARSADAMFDQERATIMKDLYASMLTAIESVAKQDNIDLVLHDDRATPLPEVDDPNRVETAMVARDVLYARQGSGLDITDRVLTIMNNAHAAGGARP